MSQKLEQSTEYLIRKQCLLVIFYEREWVNCNLWEMNTRRKKNSKNMTECMLNILAHILALLVKGVSLQDRHFWLFLLYQSRYIQFVGFLVRQANFHYTSCLCALVKLWKTTISFIVPLCPYGITWLPLGGFSRNVKFQYF